MDIYLIVWLVAWLLSSFLISKLSPSTTTRVGGGFIASLIIAVALMPFLEEMESKNSGYQNYEHFTQGKKQGFSSGEKYYAFLAKKKAEEVKRQKQVKINAEAEKERRKVKREAERKEKAIACRKDLKCWAGSDEASAIVYCKNMIEKMVQYDYKWLDESWMTSTFSHYRWKSQTDGSVSYIGDKLKLQNGFGAWSNYMYSCDYDIKNERVLDVELKAGRL